VQTKHLVYIGMGFALVVVIFAVAVGLGVYFALRPQPAQIASPPSAAHSSVESSASYSPSAGDDGEKAVDAGFLLEAARFREMAGRNLAAAAAEFKGSAALKALIDSTLSQDEVSWPLFFQGSIVFGGRLPSRAPVMVYYHPIYDTAVLTQWQKEGERWVIKRALVRSGFDLEGKGAPGVTRAARWLGGKMPLAVALQRQCADFQAQIEKLHPRMSREPGELAPAAGDAQALRELEVQLSLGVLSFRVLNQAEGMPAASFINEFRAALKDRNQSGIQSHLPRENAINASMLCQMNPEISANLRQHYAIFTPQKVLVFLIPSNQPSYLGIYEFTILPDNPTPPIKPASLVFVDLMPQLTQAGSGS
jgi:hypothetical protein